MRRGEAKTTVHPRKLLQYIHPLCSQNTCSSSFSIPILSYANARALLEFLVLPSWPLVLTATFVPRQIRWDYFPVFVHLLTVCTVWWCLVWSWSWTMYSCSGDTAALLRDLLRSNRRLGWVPPVWFDLFSLIFWNIFVLVHRPHSRCRARRCQKYLIVMMWKLWIMFHC